MWLILRGLDHLEVDILIVIQTKTDTQFVWLDLKFIKLHSYVGPTVCMNQHLKRISHRWEIWHCSFFCCSSSCATCQCDGRKLSVRRPVLHSCGVWSLTLAPGTARWLTPWRRCWSRWRRPTTRWGNTSYSSCGLWRNSETRRRLIFMFYFHMGILERCRILIVLALLSDYFILSRFHFLAFKLEILKKKEIGLIFIS